MVDFQHKLDRTKSIADIFELVKETVSQFMGRDQAGLMVGLSDLGKYPGGFVGAYYSPDANIIIINRRILERVRGMHGALYKPYVFHILLHEYIHSLGYYDEEKAREVTAVISQELGDKRVLMLADDTPRAFPELVDSRIEEPASQDIEFVHGIDRKNTDYIF